MQKLLISIKIFKQVFLYYQVQTWPVFAELIFVWNVDTVFKSLKSFIFFLKPHMHLTILAVCCFGVKILVYRKFLFQILVLALCIF